MGRARTPSLAVAFFGAVLFLGGYAVAIAAGLDLGIEETKCLEGDLRTGGWYRYSRNPQYIGYIAATIGFGLIANAPLVVLLCAIYLVWWLSFPHAEEPWLREQYGEAYERYVATHPRFVGRRTFGALRDRFDSRADAGIDREQANDW